MRFAVYSRKSKFTGKGESIDNQIEDCRKFILSCFPETKESDIFVYEDEGYSGKNTNRPQFRKMMSEQEKQPFDFIVVYRLDRISRNMADFALLIDKLTKMGTSFYSTNERFDTSTLSGQMMMTISAAFAQFERRIIAERVRDNVYKLAKTGRWLGGTPPLGFFSERVELTDKSGSGRKLHRLRENPSEIELVRLIYAKYLETRSLKKVETFLLNNGYRTRKNAVFHVAALRYILTNPTYCTADTESLEYFREADCDINETDEVLSGEHGFIGYKKTHTQIDDSRESAEMSDWTIAVGQHKGVISSADWIEVQQIIAGNAEKKLGYRQPHNSTALLSGLLRCKCGSFMRPKYYRENKSGEKPFAYMCELKETSKREKCSSQNVNGTAADRMVCDTLINFEGAGSAFAQYISEAAETGEKNCDIKSLIKTQAALIEKKQKTISGLLRMAVDSSGIALEYIQTEINKLHSEISAAETEIKRLERFIETDDTPPFASLSAEEALSYFKVNFQKMSTENKRCFIKKCVSRVEWDGENISVFLIDG